MGFVKRHWLKLMCGAGMVWFTFTATNYLVVTETGKGIEVTDNEGDVTIIVVAATGSSGFPVDAFCADPLTTVTPSISTRSDQPEGYQLERVRNNVHEAVIWNGQTAGATHFWFDNGEQKSDPAVVNDDAKKCIERKAKQ